MNAQVWRGSSVLNDAFRPWDGGKVSDREEKTTGLMGVDPAVIAQAAGSQWGSESAVAY